MKICKLCSKRYKDEAEFCFECGIKLEVVEEKRKCTQCGCEIKDFMKFCPECGLQIDDIIEVEENNTKQDNLRVSSTHSLGDNIEEKRVKKEDTTQVSDNEYSFFNKKVGLAIAFLVILHFFIPGLILYSFDMCVIVGLGWFYLKKFFVRRKYLEVVAVLIVVIVGLVGVQCLKEYHKKLVRQTIYNEYRTGY